MRIASVILALSLGCGSAAPPSETPQGVNKPNETHRTGTTDQQVQKHNRIVGKVERLPDDPKRRRIIIWGKVQKIIGSEHDQLPPAQAVSHGGVGDPVTEIRNSTPYGMTIWFAGPCAHHTTVPSGGTVTSAFCGGTYNIAAVVDDTGYLPLVRANQEFKGGVGYVLQLVIKQRPR